MLTYYFPVSFMSDTNTPWFAATIGLAGIIVGYTIANGMNGISVALPAPTQQGGAASVAQVPPPSNDTPATVDDDPMIGEDDAPITVIEFTDFQCPFCNRHYEQTYKQIKKNYIDTGKVKYVSRDFPLGFHQFAQKAGEAAECADDQGKFWEMHGLLFANQATWSALPDALPTFAQYAKDLSLNMSTFDSCLSTGKYKDEVIKDQADGSASGIDGTPGFWILGPDGKNQKISGAYPYETFSAAFDAMLK